MEPTCVFWRSTVIEKNSEVARSCCKYEAYSKALIALSFLKIHS